MAATKLSGVAATGTSKGRYVWPLSGRPSKSLSNKGASVSLLANKRTDTPAASPSRSLPLTSRHKSLPKRPLVCAVADTNTGAWRRSSTAPGPSGSGSGSASATQPRDSTAVSNGNSSKRYILAPTVKQSGEHRRTAPNLEVCITSSAARGLTSGVEKKGAGPQLKPS